MHCRLQGSALLCKEEIWGLERLFHLRLFGYHTDLGAGWCQSRCAVLSPKQSFTQTCHRSRPCLGAMPRGIIGPAGACGPGVPELHPLPG